MAFDPSASPFNSSVSPIGHFPDLPMEPDDFWLKDFHLDDDVQMGDAENPVQPLEVDFPVLEPPVHLSITPPPQHPVENPFSTDVFYFTSRQEVRAFLGDHYKNKGKEYPHYGTYEGPNTSPVKYFTAQSAGALDVVLPNGNVAPREPMFTIKKILTGSCSGDTCDVWLLYHPSWELKKPPMLIRVDLVTMEMVMMV